MEINVDYWREGFPPTPFQTCWKYLLLFCFELTHVSNSVSSSSSRLKTSFLAIGQMYLVSLDNKWVEQDKAAISDNWEQKSCWLGSFTCHESICWILLGNLFLWTFRWFVTCNAAYYLRSCFSKAAKQHYPTHTHTQMKVPFCPPYFPQTFP